jgi:hypothetical protein
MGDTYVAVGFYKGERTFLTVDLHGRTKTTKNASEAAQFDTIEVAAVAACLMELRTKLAGCRAVKAMEASNVTQI